MIAHKEDVSNETLPFSLLDIWLAARRNIGVLIGAVLIGLLLGIVVSINKKSALYRSQASFCAIDPSEAVDLGSFAKAFAMRPSITKQALARAGEPNRGYASSGSTSLPAGFEASVASGFVYLAVSDPNPEVAAKLANDWAETAVHALQERVSRQGLSESADAFVRLEALKKEAIDGWSRLSSDLADVGIVGEVHRNDKTNRSGAAPHRIGWEFRDLDDSAVDFLNRQLTTIAVEVEGLRAEEALILEAPEQVLYSPRFFERTAIRDLRGGREILLRKLENEKNGANPNSDNIKLIQAKLRSNNNELLVARDEALKEVRYLMQKFQKQQTALSDQRHKIAIHKWEAQAKVASSLQLASSLEELQDTVMRTAAERQRSALYQIKSVESAMPASTSMRNAGGLLYPVALAIFAGLGCWAVLLFKEVCGQGIRGGRDLRDECQLTSLALLSRSDASTELKRLNSVLFDGSRSKNIVALTSPASPADTAWLAQNLVDTCVKSGKHMLFVRRSSGSEASAARSDEGATPVKDAEVGVIMRRAEYDVLDWPAAGARKTPDALRQALEKVRSDYDGVILDLGATLAEAEAPTLSKAADLTLLVLHSRVTRRIEIKRACDLLRLCGPGVQLAVVMGMDRHDLRADGAL